MGGHGLSMKSVATSRFWKAFEKLPAAIQRRARQRYLRWRRDPADPALHFKKAGGWWCVRVDQGYRAVGYLKGETMHWDWIGDHDGYEEFLRERRVTD